MDTRAQSDLRKRFRQALIKHGGVRLAILSGSCATGCEPTDLIGLQHAGEPVREKVLKHGVGPLGRDEEHSAPLNRHVFGAADFLPDRNRIMAERRLAWIGHQSNRRSRPWTTSIPL